MSSRRPALVVVLAVAAGLGWSAPAHAASGRIREISATDTSLTVVFSAADLPAGAAVDPSTVAVTVDGERVDAAATAPDDTPRGRTAVLVIDTSGSMRGEGIAGAQAAALAFVAGVPADVRVGLITFADTARVEVAPTTDRRPIVHAVRELRPAGETALFDGIALALGQLAESDVSSVLVLSDGADTASRTTVDAVLASAQSARVAVDTVGFRTDEAVTGVLTRVSTETRGRALNATSISTLSAAFTQVARDVATQITVRAPVPAALAGRQVTVRVSARAGGQLVTDEAVTTVAARSARTTAPGSLPAPAPAPVPRGVLHGDTALFAALGLLFTGLLVLTAAGAGALRRDAERSKVRRRLSRYTLHGRDREPEAPSALGTSAVARSAVDLAGRVVSQRNLESVLGLRLEQADVPLRPAEWLIVHAAVVLVPALGLLVVTSGAVVPTTAALLLGAGAPLGFLSFRAARRGRAFLAQMPDTLQLLAGSLSAGYSLPQALDAVVREGAQPIAKEFQRALIESRLGVPVEDALDDVAARMRSRDFEWVVMAVRIQREVGGNLAEVLSTVAATMRERERVRRQVRVLSAEGRLSAAILGGLPPLFAAYLTLVNPAYISPLVTDPIGLLMLAVMGALFVTGVLWLRKVVRVEV